MSPKLSLFISCLSVLIVLLTAPEKFSYKDDDYILFVSNIIIVNVLVYFYQNKRYFDSWIRFDTLFIIGFLIVHFQIPYLSTFGIEPVRGNYVWTNLLVVNYAIMVSGVALLLWIIGYYFFLIFGYKSLAKVPMKDYRIQTRPIFNILLISSLLTFCIQVGAQFWSGQHAGVYNWGAGATYSFLILRTLLTLSVIYLFINNKGAFTSIPSFIKTLYRNKTLFLIVIFYCCIFLYVGDRGPVMQLLIVFIGGYTLFNRNISLSSLILTVIMGSIIFTIIGLGRSSEKYGDNGNVFSKGYENFVKGEFIIPTEELASSVRILYRAIDVVPSQHPYLNGVTIGSNLIDIIPFSSNVVNIPPLYRNSTAFFTIWEKGTDFEFGDGSEIIADLYINFGVWGALPIFIIFGYYIARLTYKATYVQNHTTILIYLGLLALAIYINRSNFLVPLKPILYTIVFDFFLAKKRYA